MPIHVTRHPLASSATARRLAHVAVDLETVERLQQSFAMLEPAGDELSRRFYDTLFQRFPRVRSLFPADMTSQRRKLFDALKAVIDNLCAPEVNRPALEAMGARHVGYGTKPEHYRLVREALVDAMAECAGTAWTPTLHEEWTSAIDLVGEIMLEGAAKEGGGGPATQGPASRR